MQPSHQWLDELNKDGLLTQYMNQNSPTQEGIVARLVHNWQSSRLEKAVAKRTADLATIYQSDPQGALVNPSFHLMGLYDTHSNVREKTSVTFDALRAMRNQCEPAAAIINRIRQMGAAYANLPHVQAGFVKETGYRIRMTRREQEPGKKSIAEMRELEQFIGEAGWSAPPEDEKPANWQPGFGNFISQWLEDSATLDYVAVRTWQPKDKAVRDKWAISCFACEDAARVRRIKRPAIDLKNGILVTQDWQGERQNNKGEIAYVKLQTNTESSLIESEYTFDEMATYVRNSRTDTHANGYGCSELEQSINAVTGWLWARDYNLSRFRNDSLPRGVMVLKGNLDERALSAFRMEWKQSLKGWTKRWDIPIIRGLTGDGAGVDWLDMGGGSSRDMEYHSMTFAMSLWLHANYGMHPEETGYEALSPFKPPLSEASPEAKLKNGNDWCHRPIMTHLANFINRYIIWRIYPNREYTFEWVGMGDYIESAQVEIWAAELNSGLNTPRNIWRHRDMVIPESIAEHPAWDLPMPFAQGMEYIDSLAEKQQVMQQQQQQAAMQSEQAMSSPQMQMPGQDQGGGGAAAVPAPMGNPDVAMKAFVLCRSKSDAHTIRKVLIAQGYRSGRMVGNDKKRQ